MRLPEICLQFECCSGDYFSDGDDDGNQHLQPVTFPGYVLLLSCFVVLPALKGDQLVLSA